MVKVRAFRTLENSLRRMGFNYVAGVDEVGRGCLAGPVVAAAVVLDPNRYIPRICDSKTVTALEREKLFKLITRAAIAWGVAGCDPIEIDDVNIHQASLRAMRKAVMSLIPLPDIVLVDAFRVPRSADGPASRDPRGCELHRHRGGVDRRQGHARPRDGRVARERPALRL